VTTPSPTDPARFIKALSASEMTIYDPITIGDPEFWIPAPELEVLLNDGMVGVSLAGLKLRTRLKVIKAHVCRCLGYPVPLSFKRTRPRFPGQLLDVYAQKSNNLQIWNDELAATRRYAIVRVSPDDAVSRVKVVTGDALAPLDTTGTLTQKYQARCLSGSDSAELASRSDTDLLRPFLCSRGSSPTVHASPTGYPAAQKILPLQVVFKRLTTLVGKTFADAGHDQERNRGMLVHRLCCEALGYGTYQDDGQFPDIRHQLVEIKLQTAATIDLGLVCPDSSEPLDVPQIQDVQIRHCDTRYAIFCAKIENGHVRITHLILLTGQDFFKRFPKFGGRVLNRKLQIPLPADFFDI
jgi:hypothetical protein